MTYSMNSRNVPEKDFYLIETMCWQTEAAARQETAGFPLLEMHLSRLERSALFFGFRYDEPGIKRILAGLSRRLGRQAPEGAKRFRVRTTLRPSGLFQVTHVDELVDVPTPVRVDISEKRVDPEDLFLYHKTSRRGLFHRERKRISPAGFFDTLFLNKRGEVTQGTITNVFVDAGRGKMLTPAVECGLLPGILRQKLIEEGAAVEAVLTTEDILQAHSVYVGNSVRGLLTAKITSLPTR